MELCCSFDDDDDDDNAEKKNKHPITLLSARNQTFRPQTWSCSQSARVLPDGRIVSSFSPGRDHMDWAGRRVASNPFAPTLSNSEWRPAPAGTQETTRQTAGQIQTAKK